MSAPYLSERHYETLRWLEVNPHHESEIRKPRTPKEDRLISGAYGSLIVTKEAWAYVADFLCPSPTPDRVFGITPAGLAAMRAKEAAAQSRAHPRDTLEARP